MRSVNAAELVAETCGTRELEDIADCLGVKVFELPFGSIQGVSGVYLGEQFIGVKAGLDKESRKAVIAHELGHLLLHPHTNFLFAQELDYYDYLEQEANEFADALINKD